MSLIILSNNGAWDSTAMGVLAIVENMEEFDDYISFRFPAHRTQAIYADNLPNFKQVLTGWQEDNNIAEILCMGEATAAMLITSSVPTVEPQYLLYVAVELTK